MSLSFRVLTRFSHVLGIDTVFGFTGLDLSCSQRTSWWKFGRLSEHSKVNSRSQFSHELLNILKDIIDFENGKVHISAQPWGSSLSVRGNSRSDHNRHLSWPLACPLWLLTALVILKIFTAEFYSIGALFALYGTGILLTSLFRRQQGNKEFFSEIGDDGITQKRFRTSGNVVVVLTALSIAAYTCLLGLTFNLEDWGTRLYPRERPPIHNPRWLDTITCNYPKIRI